MAKHFSLRSSPAVRPQIHRPDDRLQILSVDSYRFRMITQHGDFNGRIGEKLKTRSFPIDRFRTVTHQEDVLQVPRVLCRTWTAVQHRDWFHNVTVLPFLSDAARHAVSVSVYSCLETWNYAWSYRVITALRFPNRNCPLSPSLVH